MALTAVSSDPAYWEGTHIKFIYNGDMSQTRKTSVWDVLAKADGYHHLGVVKWFSRWRKYAFYPSPGCVFEEVCLRDIADFVVWATKAHKEKSY